MDVIGTEYDILSYASPPIWKLHPSGVKHTSSPSTVATFLTICLMAVLQLSRYSVFHNGDTPIQLGLPWWSYSCQCLNTETPTQSNRGFTTETPSIFYTFCLYVRLVVILQFASLIINEDKLLLNSISGVQRQHTNQYSLPSRTSFHHLKLQPCGRQMAQHISWSQDHSTSLPISESILQTSTPVWTVPDTYIFKASSYFIIISLIIN